MSLWQRARCALLGQSWQITIVTKQANTTPRKSRTERPEGILRQLFYKLRTSGTHLRQFLTFFSRDEGGRLNQGAGVVFIPTSSPRPREYHDRPPPIQGGAEIWRWSCSRSPGGSWVVVFSWPGEGRGRGTSLILGGSSARGNTTTRPLGLAALPSSLLNFVWWPSHLQGFLPDLFYCSAWACFHSWFSNAPSGGRPVLGCPDTKACPQYLGGCTIITVSHLIFWN